MKRYAAYIKPYLSAFLLAPLLMLTEVFGEILLPKFMSLIINNGVADRDTGYIIRMGIIMVLTAIVMAAGESEELISLQRLLCALPVTCVTRYLPKCRIFPLKILISTVQDL